MPVTAWDRSTRWVHEVAPGAKASLPVGWLIAVGHLAASISGQWLIDLLEAEIGRGSVESQKGVVVGPVGCGSAEQVRNASPKSGFDKMRRFFDWTMQETVSSLTAVKRDDKGHWKLVRIAHRGGELTLAQSRQTRKLSRATASVGSGP